MAPSFITTIVIHRSEPCVGNQREMSRRQAYRVPVPDRGNIKLSVEMAGWPAIAARICDATADGLGISIPTEVPLPVNRGERLRLTVWMVNENRAITLDADVMTVQEQGEARRYGVQFTTPDRARRELSEVLGLVFNRRSAPRVPPQAGQRALVTAIDQDGVPFSAAVTNVSENGLALQLPTLIEGVQTDTACLVSLDLEMDGVSVRLPGRICRHEGGPDPQLQQWGIALDIDPTTLGDACYARFRSYVIDRTREALVCA